MDKPESEQIKHKTYVLELPAPDNYMQGGRNSPVKRFSEDEDSDKDNDFESEDDNLIEEIKESVNRINSDEKESKFTDRLSVMYNESGQKYHFNILPIFNPNPSDCDNKSHISNLDLVSVEESEQDNHKFNAINQDKIISVDNNAEEDKADFSRDNDSEENEDYIRRRQTTGGINLLAFRRRLFDSGNPREKRATLNIPLNEFQIENPINKIKLRNKLTIDGTKTKLLPISSQQSMKIAKSELLKQYSIIESLMEKHADKESSSNDFVEKYRKDHSPTEPNFSNFNASKRVELSERSKMDVIFSEDSDACENSISSKNYSNEKPEKSAKLYNSNEEIDDEY